MDTLDAKTQLESTLPPASTLQSEPLFANVWPAIQEWLVFFRGLTLAAGSALSCGVAAAGLSLLLFLAVTLTFSPASDTFSRRLELDFSQSDLVAEALFLPEALMADGLLPADPQRDARFLAPQQAVDVWVELEVPRAADGRVAQVVAQLASLDGRAAAKASRALLLQNSAWSPGALATSPLRWLGLACDTRTVRVPLFSNYREKRDVPFMAAKIAIKTRTPGWAVEVVSATLRVRLRLGLVRRALYMLRPRPPALLLLGSAALVALGGGGAAALVCLALLLYAGMGRGGPEPGGARDEVSSTLSADVEVSSAGDVSEASSNMLRDLEEEGEPPSPRLHPGMVATAEGEAAGESRARKASRPADSAMGDDGERAPGKGGGLLRRRARE